MDILDRLLEHDAWTTQQLLLRAATLPDDDLDRHFDIGHHSLRKTFNHIIGNMEVWTALMAGRSVASGAPKSTTLPAFQERLATVARDLATLARRIRDTGQLDTLWTEVLDDPSTQKTYGGTIAHVITHSNIHRGEIMHMLERLGVKDVIEGDVLSWEQQFRDS